MGVRITTDKARSAFLTEVETSLAFNNATVDLARAFEQAQIILALKIVSTSGNMVVACDAISSEDGSILFNEIITFEQLTESGTIVKKIMPSELSLHYFGEGGFSILSPGDSTNTIARLVVRYTLRNKLFFKDLPPMGMDPGIVQQIRTK